MLKSTIPSHMNMLNIRAADLHKLAEGKLSRFTCYSLQRGNLPSMKTLAVLCELWNTQPSAFLKYDNNGK